MSRSLGGRNQGLVDDVPLGVAAADAERPIADGQDRLDRAPIVAVGEGERSLDQRAADLGHYAP